MTYSQKTSVLLLSLIEFLERFSYYGTRAILVLFAIDENGLGLQRSDALSYYTLLIYLSFLLPLPVGILSDLILKQKNGTLIGGVFALLGYTFLFMEEISFVIIGLILMSIGTSFVRTNLPVLVGRLFEKTDKNRNFGFMFFYYGINLGAFIGILTIGIISEEFGWKYGFMISALVTLLYVILLYFIKDHLPLIEKNINQKYLETNTLNDTIIDSELTQVKKQPTHSPILLIIIFTLILSLFWCFYDISNAPFNFYLSQKENLILMGFNISFSMLQTIPFVFYTILIFVFFLIWYFQGLGSSIGKIALSMIFLGISIQIMHYVINFSGSNFMSYAVLSLFIYSIAEVLIAPFVVSYITRLSDIRYSSTIVGLLITLPAIGYKFSGFLSELMVSDPFPFLNSIAIFSLSIGLLLIFFRKKLLKMSGGLD